MSNVLNPHAFKARKIARQEAKADYDKNPVLCAVCPNPVPFGRFVKGMRTCCHICKGDLAQKTLRERRRQNHQPSP